MTTTNKKFETLKDANSYALRQTIKAKNQQLYVIESRGSFYVDDSGFIRTWEKLHATFENGKKVRL